MDQPEFTDETGAGLSTDLIARTWEPAPLVAAAALRAAELVARAPRDAGIGTAKAASDAPAAAADAGRWWATGVRDALEGRLS